MLLVLWYIPISHAALIFLDGASSAGKSSICTILRTYDQCGVVASLYWDWGQDHLAQLFPDEFLSIQCAFERDNITHALRRDIFLFKPGIMKEEKDKALKSIKSIRTCLSNEVDSSLYDYHMQEFKKYSLEKLHECLTLKKHVILDGNWYLDIEHIPTDRKIYSVLIYCPLHIMIHRIIERNKKAFEMGNMKDHRFFSEGIRSFLKKYDITSESKRAIDSMHKEATQEALLLMSSLLEPTGPQERLVVSEFTPQEFAACKQEILEKFMDNEILYVVPKNEYDVILYTHQQDSEQCAEYILKLVSSQEK